MRVTHNGREIEVISPKNPHGQCGYTVNGQGPREGERFIGAYGESAADIVKSLTAHFDQLDAQGPAGIKGSPEWAWAFKPGSWEKCPAPGLNSHIRPVGHPCNEPSCVKAAAKAARAAQVKAEGHPAAAALTAQLRRAGFEPASKTNNRQTDAGGFRVMVNNPYDRREGVRVVWYAPGRAIPMDGEPGRCQEIADFLSAKGTFAVHYAGASRIEVVSKTHGVFPK